MNRPSVSTRTLIVITAVTVLLCGCSDEGNETSSRAPQQEGTERIYHSVDEMPRQMNQVTVQYPQDALDAGIEGTVHVKMLLSREGIVESAEVSVSSGSPSLDEAALEAAKQCRFRPGLVNGKPVRMWLYKAFPFKLSMVNR